MKTKNLLLIFTLGFACLLILTSGIITKTNSKKQKPAYVRFDNNLFVSSTEVTNQDYGLFLQDLKFKNQSDFSKFNYDSTLWVKKLPNAYSEPFMKNYHSHPAFDQYPIVNISMEAAMMYCYWLTETYNNDSKRKCKKVLFRLPTEAEWMKFATPLPGHNLPWYGNLPYVESNISSFLANVKLKDFSQAGKVDYVSDGGFIAQVVGNYRQNKLGLYDIIGNVSEMTSDGKLKGGSWDNFLEESTIEKTQAFELPDPRVGFRVVMEVLEE